MACAYLCPRYFFGEIIDSTSPPMYCYACWCCNPPNPEQCCASATTTTYLPTMSDCSSDGTGCIMPGGGPPPSPGPAPAPIPFLGAPTTSVCEEYQPSSELRTNGLGLGKFITKTTKFDKKDGSTPVDGSFGYYKIGSGGATTTRYFKVFEIKSVFTPGGVERILRFGEELDPRVGVGITTAVEYVRVGPPNGHHHTVFKKSAPSDPPYQIIMSFGHHTP
jgi:hypothetical protein